VILTIEFALYNTNILKLWLSIYKFICTKR